MRARECKYSCAGDAPKTKGARSAPRLAVVKAVVDVGELRALRVRHVAQEAEADRARRLVAAAGAWSEAKRRNRRAERSSAAPAFKSKMRAPPLLGSGVASAVVEVIVQRAHVDDKLRVIPRGLGRAVVEDSSAFLFFHHLTISKVLLPRMTQRGERRCESPSTSLQLPQREMQQFLEFCEQFLAKLEVLPSFANCPKSWTISTIGGFRMAGPRKRMYVGAGFP